MRLFLLIALVATAAHAQDATVDALVEQALAHRLELTQATARTRVLEERVPQVSAWPEPVFQVGVQNESFNRWNVGVAPMNFISFSASQTIPFPGKNALREQVAQTDVTLSELATERVRLETVAEVRRGYVALLLVKEQQLLAERLVSLDARLLEFARLRAETAMGSQAEVLRAEVELARARQTQTLLSADEDNRIHDLNRLCGAPLARGLTVGSQLSSLGFPHSIALNEAVAKSMEQSPELHEAKVGDARADSAAALARRSLFPDVTVSAGVMVRGTLDPMWAVSVSVPLPVFAASRQLRAVAEADAEAKYAKASADVVEQSLTVEAHHRARTLESLRVVWDSYQDGLLTRADAAAESSLASYAAGKGPLSAVLEASALAIAEREASLRVLAQAWGVVIEQDEVPAPGRGM